MKNSFARLRAALIAAAALMAASRCASFHAPGHPILLDGAISGAPYKIRVPADWNGTLLLYAHGYRGRAHGPGESELRSPADAPGQESPLLTDMEAVFLSRGFALAGSAYRENGWAVREGIEDTLALKALFDAQVGRPKRTIVWGLSLGSIVAAKSVEETPKEYDGAICGCFVGAGASRSWDRILDIALAYDAAFGWPPAWGSAREVAPDVDYARDVAPMIVRHLGDTDWLGRFEFVRLIAGAGPEDFYQPIPNRPALLDLMFFATEARAELQKRAGGPVGQNVGRRYDLAPDAKAYLASLRVDADSLLAKMNAHTNVAESPRSAAYLARGADFSGRIDRPVLTLHTIVDAMVLPAQESAYRASVLRAGREASLVQVFTNGQSHCGFTESQFLASVLAMDSWLATGRRPAAEAFLAKNGFVADFHPPPWPP